SISIIPRRTNRARSSVTQSPHGRGPLSSECSTPSGTRCTLNSDWVSSTAAANGCSPRCLAACITLIRLGQSTWAARLSWRAFCVAQPRKIVRVKRVTDFIETTAAGATKHLEKLVRFDLALEIAGEITSIGHNHRALRKIDPGGKSHRRHDDVE